jgi:hypothetical protein
MSVSNLCGSCAHPIAKQDDPRRIRKCGCESCCWVSLRHRQGAEVVRGTAYALGVALVHRIRFRAGDFSLTRRTRRTDMTVFSNRTCCKKLVAAHGRAVHGGRSDEGGADVGRWQLHHGQGEPPQSRSPANRSRRQASVNEGAQKYLEEPEQENGDGQSIHPPAELSSS